MPRLENWSVINYDDSPYLAPELRTTMLQGEIYNDENNRFEDGKKITTSRLLELNFEENYGFTLSGTRYILGNMSKDYENWLKENDIVLKSTKVIKEVNNVINN